MRTNSSLQVKSHLSTREKEILELLSFGYSSPEIASSLYISPHTVNDHRKSILHKMCVKNVAQMIRKGFELELLNASSH